MAHTAKGYHYQPYQRQRPVSCHFCRTRKLRCDRESPCSNCSARGVTCHLYAPDTKPDASDTPEVLEVRDVLDVHGDLTRGVLSRLERLEQVLLRSTSTIPPSAEPRPSGAVARKVSISPAGPDVSKRRRSSVVRKKPQFVTDAELLEHACVEYPEVSDSHYRPLTLSTNLTHNTATLYSLLESKDVANT